MLTTNVSCSLCKFNAYWYSWKKPTKYSSRVGYVDVQNFNEGDCNVSEHDLYL
jgi:hypothetical protein